MLKKFMQFAALVVAVATMPLVMTSCSDDDEPETPTRQLDHYDVTYTVSVGGDLTTYCDYTISYTAPSGSIETVAPSVDEWTNSTMLSYEFTGDCEVAVNISRNSTLAPTSGSVSLNASVALVVRAVYNDGTSSLVGQSSNTSTTPIQASSLDAFVAEHPTRSRAFVTINSPAK